MPRTVPPAAGGVPTIDHVAIRANDALLWGPARRRGMRGGGEGGRTRPRQRNPVDAVACRAGTIGYEILTSLGHRYHPHDVSG